jgi:hypothetical protein
MDATRETTSDRRRIDQLEQEVARLDLRVRALAETVTAMEHELQELIESEEVLPGA